MKRLTAILIAFIMIILSVSLVSCHKWEDVDVTVSGWNYPFEEGQFDFGKVQGDLFGQRYYPPPDGREEVELWKIYALKDRKTFLENLKSNEYYCFTAENFYNRHGGERSALIFFKNDCYYSACEFDNAVLKEVYPYSYKEGRLARFSACYATFETQEGDLYYFPHITGEYIEGRAHQKDMSHDWEFILEYYSRFSNDVVTIDEENKTFYTLSVCVADGEVTFTKEKNIKIEYIDYYSTEVSLVIFGE